MPINNENTKVAKVLGCQVGSCSYNKTNVCTAAAITIGLEKDKAACVTFIPLTIKGGSAENSTFVGACSKQDCTYNINLGCSASEVRVGASEAECLTYSPR